MHTIAIRLQPGQDLAEALQALVVAQGLRAALVLTCVGSLTQARLRLADRDEGSSFAGPFEIVALVGTLCPDGNHLHVALADGDGHMLGGHLLDGCLVYTTAEIVVGALEQTLFSRAHDQQTGYDELVVTQRSGDSV